MIKKLAKLKEEQGQIAEAADLMQEIAVCHFRMYILLLAFWVVQTDTIELHSAIGLFCHFLHCSHLPELQVETFGAMAKTEKIAFILEQVWGFLPCLFNWFVSCHFWLAER